MSSTKTLVFFLIGAAAVVTAVSLYMQDTEVSHPLDALGSNDATGPHEGPLSSGELQAPEPVARRKEVVASGESHAGKEELPEPAVGQDHQTAPALSWGEKYGKASLEELIRAEASLSKAIESASEPELRRRFELGFGEYLGQGTTLTVTNHDPLEICSYIFQPNGQGIYKVSLPREEFEELYEKKAEAVWLEDAIDERHHLAALAAR